MKITNDFGLPEPVYLALTHDDYTRGESNRSVTQLIDAPQARILRQEWDERVVEDVSERCWLALGKGVHSMFEKYAKGKYEPEERMFAEVDGWVVSGAIDIQYLGKPLDDGRQAVELYDYKVTSVYSLIYGKDGEDEPWACQLNFYAWLAEMTRNVKVTKLNIIVILRDWKQNELKKNPNNYPAAPIMQIPIKLWSEAKRDNYVRDRVRVHQDAEFERLTGGDLPHCTDQERWRSPTTYAVMKNKNKRAAKVCETREQAEAWIKDTEAKIIKKKPDVFVIEERLSTPKRCADGWCRIANWCPQYQAELGNDLPQQELLGEE